MSRGKELEGTEPALWRRDALDQAETTDPVIREAVAVKPDGTPEVSLGKDLAKASDLNPDRVTKVSFGQLEENMRATHVADQPAASANTAKPGGRHYVPGSALAKLDTNGDGAIDEAEAKAATNAPRQLLPLWAWISIIGGVALLGICGGRALASHRKAAEVAKSYER